VLAKPNKRFWVSNIHNNFGCHAFHSVSRIFTSHAFIRSLARIGSTTYFQSKAAMMEKCSRTDPGLFDTAADFLRSLPTTDIVVWIDDSLSVEFSPPPSLGRGRVAPPPPLWWRNARNSR